MKRFIVGLLTLSILVGSSVIPVHAQTEITEDDSTYTISGEEGDSAVQDVDVNVSKSGLGLSVGPKGAKVSVNPKGDVYGNVSIPGTGISYREKLNKNNKKKK